jgi:hypothetical protein
MVSADRSFRPDNLAVSGEVYHLPSTSVSSEGNYVSRRRLKAINLGHLSPHQKEQHQTPRKTIRPVGNLTLEHRANVGNAWRADKLE